jgi:hypothetical protein
MDLIMRTALLFGCLLLSAAADARRCELNGEDVNPDNGSTTAGKSGLMRCFRDDGSLWYEQELKDGEHLGLDRWHDEDGGVRERSVNAQGNTEGRARQWWPGGQLREDGEFRNADAIGTHQSWHRNGQLQALRVYPEAGKPAALSMEWDDTGRLRELRCAPRSLAEADRKTCGHAGKVAVALHDARGRVRETRAIERGEVRRSEHYADGVLAASVESTAKGRIETSFHANGAAAQRDVVEDGYRVLREQWYMNGAPKVRITVEPKDRDARVVSESFRDDGTLQERTVEIGRRTQKRESFDERGALAEDWEHAPEGHVARHRKYAPDGRLLLDEQLYPDGSRKVLKAEAEIGG